MIKVEKIKNDSIESISELFSEWYIYRGGVEKGMSQFLKDEKLDILFSVKEYSDIISENALVPMSLAQPLAKAVPFEIDAIKIENLIQDSNKKKYSSAYVIDVKPKQNYAFWELYLNINQVIKLREKVVGRASYLKKGEIVDRKVYDKLKRLIRHGVSVSSMSDEQVMNYVTYDEKEKKRLKDKKHHMKSKGVDVSEMSWVDVDNYVSFKPLTEEGKKENNHYFSKRWKLQKSGVDTSIMSKEQVLGYVLKREGKLSLDEKERRKVLKAKKQKMKYNGINVKDMSWDDVGKYDMPKRQTQTKEELRRNKNFSRKKKTLEECGIDTSVMTKEQILDYSLVGFKKTKKETKGFKMNVDAYALGKANER